MKAFETRLPPPILALILAIAMFVLHRYGTTPPPTFYFRTVGVVLALLGLAVAVSAVRQFRAHKTTINPVNVSAASSLVTTGPFAVTRNPMYLALASVLVGWAFWLGGAVVWLGPIVFVAWITWLQILPEERAMRANFGATYEEYCRRTRRWI